MTHKPLGRIPKNRKNKMENTEREILKQKFMELEPDDKPSTMTMGLETYNDLMLMKRFVEENTDITLKYMIWSEQFLEPQIFNNDVQVEAEEAECEVVTVNLDKDGNII